MQLIVASKCSIWLIECKGYLGYYYAKNSNGGKNDMALSINISSARKEKGLTQEQLAEKCDVSRQAVTKWESGESEPTISKLEILSNVLEVELAELITGRKNGNSQEKNEKLIDYNTLSFMAGNIMVEYYPLEDETVRLLFLKIMYEIIRTKYISWDGVVFDKYLLKNTTEDERLKYVRLLRCERIFAEKFFQEYVEGKCEINIAFKKMADKIDEQYTAASKREEKKDKSKMAEVYYKIHRILRDMQSCDDYSEKKQNEIGASLEDVFNDLRKEIHIDRFIIFYLGEIQKAWNDRDAQFLKVLQNSWNELKGYVWSMIEI